ncbi:MFS general substrate transporter, partial [Conidiobolus coronatus NRRL 28638]
DSSYSWLMAATAFSIQFVVFGTIAIFGVYMAEYNRLDIFHTTKSMLGLVGGLCAAIYSLFALPSGFILAKFGHRFSLIVGGTLFGIALVLVSLSTELWQLFASQSVLMGVGVSLCFIPTVSLTPQWFDTYRGLAMGIISAGTGIGGLTLAPLIQRIINTWGLKWALRVNGIIGAIIVIGLSFVIRPRQQFQPPKRIFEFDLIKDPSFLAFWGMGFVLCFGYWTPLHVLPVYCEHYGIDRITAATLVGLISGSSAFGRIILGRISDKLGSINTLIISNLCVSASILFIWNFAITVPHLTVFAVTFGFFSGGFFSLASLIAPQLFGLDKLAKVNGLFYTSSTLGYTFGTFISLTIIQHFTDGSYVNYFPAQAYAATCYFLSCSFLIWMKFKSG